MGFLLKPCPDYDKIISSKVSDDLFILQSKSEAPVSENIFAIQENQKKKYIFITQKDIFESNQARYWFSEQCHDPQGMELGDGTRKCFCNMASKNGDLELVCLLQYMKNTRRDNPDVVLWSERLERLHEIVEEVRESEEWEETYMSAYSEIMEMGMQEGREVGMREGMREGMRKGKEKKTREVIFSLAERDFSPGDIAQIVKVSEKYVRQQLKKSHR